MSFEQDFKEWYLKKYDIKFKPQIIVLSLNETKQFYDFIQAKQLLKIQEFKNKLKESSLQSNNRCSNCEPSEKGYPCFSCKIPLKIFDKVFKT